MQPIQELNIVNFLNHVLYNKPLKTIEVPKVYKIPQRVQQTYNRLGYRLIHSKNYYK